MPNKYRKLNVMPTQTLEPTIELVETAEYILSRSDLSRGNDMELDKLHALLYLAQGHALAATGQPLFVDDIVAAESGPRVAAIDHILGPDVTNLKHVQPGDILQAAQRWESQENYTHGRKINDANHVQFNPAYKFNY